MKRIWPSSTAIVGVLYIDGASECFTLEQSILQGKGPIPAGTYPVIIDFSQRFQRDMPHVMDVPGCEGIRIHPGNTEADTQGCILLGTIRTGNDAIGDSRIAFDLFFTKLKQALTQGQASLAIEDPPQSMQVAEPMVVTDPELGL